MREWVHCTCECVCVCVFSSVFSEVYLSASVKFFPFDFSISVGLGQNIFRLKIERVFKSRDSISYDNSFNIKSQYQL